MDSCIKTGYMITVKIWEMKANILMLCGADFYTKTLSKSRQIF